MCALRVETVPPHNDNRLRKNQLTVLHNVAFGAAQGSGVVK
jgi:hypothetical protein